MHRDLVPHPARDPALHHLAVPSQTLRARTGAMRQAIIWVRHQRIGIPRAVRESPVDQMQPLVQFDFTIGTTGAAPTQVRPTRSGGTQITTVAAPGIGLRQAAGTVFEGRVHED